MKHEICWNDPDCWRQAFVLQADEITSRIESACKFAEGSNEALEEVIKNGEEKILQKYIAYTDTIFEKYKKDTELEDIKQRLNVDRINGNHQQNLKNELARKHNNGMGILFLIIVFIILVIASITTKK